MESFRVNERGTGSAQYHPRTMLGLLVYCYANGIFGSRRIERATYRDIGVRYVAANCHPDHDTICTFGRNNFDAVAEAFVQVLLLAKELKLLRVGTVSVDGTKVDANANKRNSIRYDRAGELREQLRVEIEELLGQAEQADREDAPDPQGLPEELSRREKLRAKLDRACAQLERRAQVRADSERAEYERKVAAREQRVGSRKGRHIKPPKEEPEAKEQINLTDADSSLMRKSKHHEYRQAYNAQAAVDADGSQLVLGSRVSVSASDRNELVADVDAIPAALGAAERVLADNGYATGREVSGVDPNSWTPDPLGRRYPPCRDQDRRTRRSSGARWLSWCEPDGVRKSCHESLSRRRRRFATGSCKRTAMRGAAGMGQAPRSERSCVAFAERIVGCAKNETSWQKPRPGLLGRPYRGGLPVHESESGRVSNRHDGPGTRCLPERVLRVAHP